MMQHQSSAINSIEINTESIMKKYILAGHPAFKTTQQYKVPATFQATLYKTSYTIPALHITIKMTCILLELDLNYATSLLYFLQETEHCKLWVKLL
jgi:hypothetical protein